MAAANVSPIFTRDSAAALGALSAANTNTDGTGALVSLITGGANGTLLLAVAAQAKQTTSAGVIRMYLYDGTSAYSLVYEFKVTAQTQSASVIGWSDVWVPSHRFIIPKNYILKAAPTQAETFALTAFGGDY